MGDVDQFTGHLFKTEPCGQPDLLAMPFVFQLAHLFSTIESSTPARRVINVFQDPYIPGPNGFSASFASNLQTLRSTRNSSKFPVRLLRLEVSV